MNRLALLLITLYRKISFINPSHCIYTPSCSEYARQAFLRHTFLKAAGLTILRIARCNPFAHGGFDPVK